MDYTQDNDDLLRISRRYFSRSDQVKRPRARKNDQNWEAYLGQQDFSHKADFQSQETTPTFPLAIEQIVGTFERALTDTDDWCQADAPGIGKPMLDPAMIRGITMHYLERLWVPGNRPETAYGIQAFVGDAIKRGILEGLVICKVFPMFVKSRQYRFKKIKGSALDPGNYPAHELAGDQLEPVELEDMRICLDLIAWADYFRDPSPSFNYEIHRTRRMLHELRANPEYDQEVVDRLYGKAAVIAMNQRERREKGEQFIEPDPYEIEVFEAWGNVIDEKDGTLLHENVFWCWAGDEILRRPTPNPFLDGTRPFIVAPLIRVPGTTNHKALADHAVPMWRAANELVNLMLDQAMRAAWGVGQVRPDIMESPEEVADGIPQGYTAVLKPNVPQGQKFYERVDEGQAPQISLEMLNRIEQEVNTALATPDTKLGQLPSRQVKATEIVQAMQASGSLFESMAARFEDTFLEPLFEKVWKLIVQYNDDFIQEEFVQILGPRLTLVLSSLTLPQRWQMIRKAKFKVRGLRGVAARERTFNKLMTIVNLLSSNQQFADNFGKTFDYTKLWSLLINNSGVDPGLLESDNDDPNDPNTDAAAAAAAAQQQPPGSAGGQLDPSLAAGSGASAPGEVTPAEGQRGAESAFAPNNPNAAAAA